MLNQYLELSMIIKSHYNKKLSKLYYHLLSTNQEYLEALLKKDTDILTMHEHDLFYNTIQRIKIQTNICSVEAAQSTSQVDEHIFAPQTFARYIISNISDMSLEKFIELTLPLGHVATTTKRENTLLRNQKNIPILEKYKEADIKVYAVDVEEAILGLPQDIKDLLPQELVEVDNKQILDNALYS